MNVFPDPAEADLAELFHENTKYRAHQRRLDPAAFAKEEEYPAPRALEMCAPQMRFALPRPATCAVTLDDAIAARRSRRDMTGAALALADLARVLHLTYGVTGADGEDALRAAPSAGARYPLEWFVLARRVEGVAPGCYHYHPDARALEPLQREVPDLHRVFMGQPWLDDAAAVLVVAAVLSRTSVKYRERGYRLVLMDAGHAMAHAQLAATSAGLKTCALGGFLDDELADALDLDGIDEVPLAAVVLGG